MGKKDLPYVRLKPKGCRSKGLCFRPIATAYGTSDVTYRRIYLKPNVNIRSNGYALNVIVVYFIMLVLCCFNDILTLVVGQF